VIPGAVHLGYRRQYSACQTHVSLLPSWIVSGLGRRGQDFIVHGGGGGGGGDRSKKQRSSAGGVGVGWGHTDELDKIYSIRLSGSVKKAFSPTMMTMTMKQADDDSGLDAMILCYAIVYCYSITINTVPIRPERVFDNTIMR
jgi:hypothetical protein